MRSLIASLTVAFAVLWPAGGQARQTPGEAGYAFLDLALWLVSSVVILVALNFAMFWVACDANARGAGHAMLWMLSVFLLGPVGLVIYLFLRPPSYAFSSPGAFPIASTPAWNARTAPDPAEVRFQAN